MLAVKKESCPYPGCEAEKAGPAICPACRNVVVKCGRCNSYNRVFARYCRMCGGLLPASPPFDAHCVCGGDDGAALSSLALSGAARARAPQFKRTEVLTTGPEAEEVEGAVGAHGYIFVWTRTGRIYSFKQFNDEVTLAPLGSVGERIIPPLFVSGEHLFCFTAAKVVAYDLSSIFYLDEPAALCGEATFGTADAPHVDVRNCEVRQAGRTFYVLRHGGDKANVSAVTYAAGEDGRVEFESAGFDVDEPQLRLTRGGKDVFAFGKSLLYKLDGSISPKFKVSSQGYEFDVSSPAYSFGGKVYAYYISSAGGNYKKAVCGINVEDRRVSRFNQAVPQAANLAVTDKWVFANAANGECFLWDRGTASLVSQKRLAQQLGIEFPAFVFRDAVVVVDSDDGGVYIVDIPNDKVYATATGERGGIKKTPAYACGELIVTTENNKVCRLPVR